ncbi:MAG TPA: MFS transporter, partial [Polyangiaceae bacterium]|nr:MFS transporter [Polyangiaceae bacterium]
HLLRWLLLFSGMTLFFVGYSLYAIPYWSLLEDYSRGHEGTRTVLSNTLGAGVLLATGVGFIVSPMLVDRFGFLTGAMIFGAVGTVLMALPYFASPPGVVAHKAEELPGMWRSLGASLRHSRFLAVVLLFAGAHMSLTVMTSAAPYIAERLLGGTLKDVALLLGPFLGTAVPTFILVPRFSRRYGWEKATLLGAVILSAAYLGAGLLGQGIIGTPLQTAMLVFAVAGPGSAFVLGLEGEAVAGCAARSTYKSTGMYFGVFNLVVQTMNGLALFLTGILAEIDAKWAVRAMPMMAGGMCVLGIVVYFLSSKSDPDVTTSREIPLRT